jgi:glutathione S-transferase
VIVRYLAHKSGDSRFCPAGIGTRFDAERDRGLPGYHAKVPQIPALIERGKMRVAHFYQKFNKQLADNEFVAGDAFSVADITAIVTVDFGLGLTMPIPGSAPHVQRWYDDMQKRPSVRESVTKHAPDGTPLPAAA